MILLMPFSHVQTVNEECSPIMQGHATTRLERVRRGFNMGLCDEQPELIELLKLVIQAQLLEGHVFFVEDVTSDVPINTTNVDSILDAICEEKPLIRFSPSHRVADDAESDTCDNG